MQPITQMASKTMSQPIKGAGARKCQSWIDRFVEHTDNLDAPVLFRKWSAISLLASTLEQKVWLPSGGGILYPNLYVVIVGHPGTGKTRSIRVAKSYALELPEPHIAPTSLTAASLVDCLAEAKRFVPRSPEEPLEYNALTISADELGTFVHKYDDEMIAVLSAFYDPDPYGQNRRGKDIKIKIKRPQLNILCGSTPSNLMKFMPEGAWDQGFTSRIIMVFSDERIIKDDFAHVARGASADLHADLKVINSLVGQFHVSEDYRNLVNLWREQGEQPAPNHPKLLHYNTRRRAHLYKLSMLASVDRSSGLALVREDFNRAMNWLVEAETFMPEIFRAGSVGADSQAMEEIYHFVMTAGLDKGVMEHRIINFARERVPSQTLDRVLKIMIDSRMIEAVAYDERTKTRVFKAVPKA